MTPSEQAEASLNERIDAERSLALAYKKTFSTDAGKRVLADLQAIFPHDRPRYDARMTMANPLAAMIGSMHFDGSASVTKHILDLIKEGEEKPKPTPKITA